MCRDFAVSFAHYCAQAFSAQEFGDGAHFSYRFLVDGTLHGTSMAVQGRWRVAGDALCWRWIPSRDPEERYQVRQRGQAFSLFVNGQALFSGDLTSLPLSYPTEVSR